MSHIALDTKQAELAFRIMALCEEFYPEEDQFKENIPVLELLYKSAVKIEAGEL
ncbi:hypothetical protein ISREJYDI_CDS0054 [Pseudomonas phage UNO-G1W1]|uniref:Uncharacterized protein n=1 Tax=Pseudomonas phage UNO-G1W1 TaxID=3136609 RepID=A0AAX4MVN9_9CAUD